MANAQSPSPSGAVPTELDTPLVHPPGFRARRGMNWGSIGLLYASYYMCRYNFPIANDAISSQYHLDNTHMGMIISANQVAYAIGQMVNGLITDRIGGRKAMLTGAAGAVLFNLLFGWSSMWGGGALSSKTMLGLFMLLWGCNGYLQSFGAPGMIKINAAWFHRTERGRFAGIFGFMINLGRFAIGTLGPLLLGGFSLLWFIAIPPLHWRWLFWVPAGITAVIACILYLCVQESPEEAGFPQERTEAEDRSPDPTVAQLFWTVFSNPVVWITAGAYACTGVVRQGVDQWFPKFVRTQYNVDLKSPQFAALVIGIPLVATLGSLVSGYVSDIFFKGRRAPVAAALYLLETFVILSAAFFVNAHTVGFFLILIAFTSNATHSILGTAAAMDIGGKKMAGFASGVIDSFQYYGGFLSGAVLGAIIDHFGWGGYFYFMAPFGLIGAALMFFCRNRMVPKPIVSSAAEVHFDLPPEIPADSAVPPPRR